MSGTDFGDRMGRGSGQFAESAVDTLSVARNRDRWCGVRVVIRSPVGVESQLPFSLARVGTVRLRQIGLQASRRGGNIHAEGDVRYLNGLMEMFGYPRQRWRC